MSNSDKLNTGSSNPTAHAGAAGHAPAANDDLVRRRALLSPAKRALLEQRLQGLAREAPRQAIPVLADRTAAPLSFGQQRFWFSQQWDPHSAAYNRATTLRLQGELHVPSLERSLQQVIARHEILRTTFPAGIGEPVQRVQAASRLALPSEDLSRLSPAEREPAARRQMLACLRRPFNLETGPLVRLQLYRLGEADHILLLVAHHILFDAWSEICFVNDLAALYEAAAAGAPATLPPLPIQYIDFAAWQKAQAAQGALSGDIAYWQDRLGGALPVLDLPTDRPRPPDQTYAGASESLALPAGLVEGLEAIGRQEEATLFMTLLAAFAAMLYRFSGQDDIIIGSPLAGRSRAETESLIGVFINMLPLRIDLAGHPSFLDLLRRVRQACLGAYSHQDLPFDMLVDLLKVERDLSRTPVFQVVLNLENLPARAASAGSLRLAPFELDGGVAYYDLAVELARRDGAVSGALVGNSDLFDAAAIRRLAGHFQTLLQGIAADPGQCIDDLPLLSEAERRQMLVEWNDTRCDDPRHRCIHHLFEEQAARTPDAPAVVCGALQLTYAELNERANRLARHLQGLGAGPETLVGLCVDRSPEMIVGLLGILKAGGAYVPLDPSYPRERLAFMLSDSSDAQAPLLLTQERLRGLLPEHGAEVVYLDADWPAIAADSGDNLAAAVSSDNLAYVIYTSGSTGRPKGVMIEHAMLLSFWQGLERAVYDRYPNRRLRVALNAPFSFDASIKQWLCLLGGHTLYIVPDEIRRDADALVSWLRGNAIDILDCVPSHLRLLLEAGLLGEAGAPLAVLVGGEAIDQALWVRLAGAQHTLFFNMYGPTECTVDSTICCIQEAGPRATIGRPMANRTVYILDPRGNAAPIGVPGEIYIGGEGIGRGYWRRPELTAERFVPDPFSATPGARLYRSGDLARYRPSGAIEFLGRMDNQVKIRGFRIELGEIETALAEHPAVQQCVAAARDEADGERRLVAYVTSLQTPRPAVGELRSFLQRTLPDYMLPAAFVFLDALPLTPNGKVDRRALPAPDALRPAIESDFVPASNAVEAEVADIWAQVLKLDRVGIHDNFFDLGGHSLLATQVLSRLRAAFGVPLPLRSIFETPTVAALAETIGLMLAILDEIAPLAAPERA